MHDCFGKPLKPFDRVRAATKEELEAQGHRDPLAGFDGEKVIVGGNATSDTCNCNTVDAVEWPVVVSRLDGRGGVGMFPFQGGVGYATARTLGKVE